MTTDARIELGPEWMVIRTPYHERLVDDIKTLPRWDRKWDEAAGVWRVLRRHQDEVLPLLLRYVPSVVVVGGPEGMDVRHYSDGRREAQQSLF